MLIKYVFIVVGREDVKNRQHGGGKISCDPSNWKRRYE